MGMTGRADAAEERDLQLINGCAVRFAGMIRRPVRSTCLETRGAFQDNSIRGSATDSPLFPPRPPGPSRVHERIVWRGCARTGSPHGHDPPSIDTVESVFRPIRLTEVALRPTYATAPVSWRSSPDGTVVSACGPIPPTSGRATTAIAR